MAKNDEYSYFAIKERLRKHYSIPVDVSHDLILPTHVQEARAEVLGDGFLTEIAGRVILTAPASRVSVASELPKELAEKWERASKGNPYMLWLQGRFVEAEKANRNGAFWSTEDLQFGEMTVKHGPLNWLHEETAIVGTIADNALIHPQAQTLQQAASWEVPGYTFNGQTMTYTNTANASVVKASDMLQRADITTTPMPRPYIAAVSAVWRWINHDKVEAIEKAANTNQLYYSMECVAREMSCVSDETHEGCGRSFDYVTAMTQPGKTCEHMQARSSARRLVDPSFLGGAVILPPARPGWGSANVELVQQAASLAEQTEAASGDMNEEQWTSLMTQVMRFATA